MNRNIALIFKSDLTNENLNKLKMKLYNEWTLDDIKYLLSMYMVSKKGLNIFSDIE